ncbi:DUF4416 family protein [Aureliella helgolandensis]|uniref:GTP-binding protein n=1 Tax=Aureliella helgolandensis TaxID=2527968 RepID=A0A518GHF3_9BACT|nr:DUF4416 family protein [Aureliella helgolandensis]QDV28025.1 hypothetical protein Q31a_64180 [Aureliella helgolandensis]
MATPKPHPPTLQLVAIFSRHGAALDWAIKQISDCWGALALISPRFDHSETNYYQAEMGTGLKKQFLVVEGDYDPSRLAASKLESNGWEAEFAEQSDHADQRPLNIDPGYLTLTKLVLASAKDRAHRIYLADGIYAEECLYYLDQGWRARPWTYPDYQRSDFQVFFVEARELLKQRMAELRRVLTQQNSAPQSKEMGI